MPPSSERFAADDRARFGIRRESQPACRVSPAHRWPSYERQNHRCKSLLKSLHLVERLPQPRTACSIKRAAYRASILAVRSQCQFINATGWQIQRFARDFFGIDRLVPSIEKVRATSVVSSGDQSTKVVDGPDRRIQAFKDNAPQFQAFASRKIRISGADAVDEIAVFAVGRTLRIGLYLCAAAFIHAASPPAPLCHRQNVNQTLSTFRRQSASNSLNRFPRFAQNRLAECR